MIIVLLLLFQSLCLYCQRLVLHIHDRCFPRNARLIQEVAETVGDRKALQHLEHLELEQSKRRQKRRILEPILPLGAGVNLESCRFCAHSPQGYCHHHFHLQVKQQQGAGQAGEQDYKQLRRIRRELKRSLEQQQQQQQPRSSYLSYQTYQSHSLSSLSSGYASLSPSQEDTYSSQLLPEPKLEPEHFEVATHLSKPQSNLEQEEQHEEMQNLVTSHL